MLSKLLGLYIGVLMCSASCAATPEQLIDIVARMSHGGKSDNERKALGEEIEALTASDVGSLHKLLTNQLSQSTRANTSLLTGNFVNLLTRFPETYEDSTPFLTDFIESNWTASGIDLGIPQILLYFENADREQAVALALRCLATDDMSLRAHAGETLDRLGKSQPGLKSSVEARLANEKGLLFSRHPVPVWRKTVRSPWFWAGAPGVLGVAGFCWWWRRKKKYRTTP